MAMRILIIGIINQIKWDMMETILIIMRTVEEEVGTGVEAEAEVGEEVIDHVDEEGAAEAEAVEWADTITGVMAVTIMQTIQEGMEDRDMKGTMAEDLRIIQEIDLGLVLDQDQGEEIDQERDRSQDRNIQNVNQNQAERKG